MANKKIGFIGVGMMGHGMAKNLAQKGFATTILGHKNRAPVEDLVKLGAKEAKDLPELVKASEIIFICVTGSPQVEDLVYRKGGILESSSAGQIVVDTSTAQPGSTLKIAADLKAKGVRFADAPLARTPVEAEQGRLNTMVGADEATFKEIEPALKAFCENIFHIGEINQMAMEFGVSGAMATATLQTLTQAVNMGFGGPDDLVASLVPAVAKINNTPFPPK